MTMLTMKTNELITSANAGSAEAKAELARRHANRKAAGKKPIPAVAKFFGEAVEKAKKTAKAKAPKVLDDGLLAKYEAMPLGFLKSLIGRTKDAAKKAAMVQVFNQRSDGNEVATKKHTKPKANAKLAKLVALLGELDDEERAILRDALA